MQSFIECQFPVSKVSKESYKERKAGSSQTLTPFGKWWGRKPLILIRSAVLGCLIPSSDNPKRDSEIFLKILAMDNNGLWLRKNKNFTAQELYKIVRKSFPKYEKYFEVQNGKIKLTKDSPRYEIESAAFSTLNYDEKISMCIRPEQLDNISQSSWKEINEHLGTSAENLNELIHQLSEKRFGHNVKIGDCFCGGGSVPFEAARIGCNVFASDLNPVAGLLTWAGLNISGGTQESIDEIKTFMKKIYDEVDKEINELGIEQNDSGDRAISYIYCVETICPDCGAKVPLAPSWVIGKGTKTIVKWTFNSESNSFDEEVITHADSESIKAAENGTVSSRGMTCPHCGKTTPIQILRHDTSDSYGLRQWEQNEFEPRPDDVFQERLYAIRYEHEYKNSKGKIKTSRYYTAPTARDLKNEEKIREIVAENLTHWQEIGLVPSADVEPGDKTEEVIRNRGWRYWHQLFNARQLFLLAKLKEKIIASDLTDKLRVAGLLGLHCCANWNSKNCIWNNDDHHANAATLYNQAFNTLFNYGVRSFKSLDTVWFYNINNYPVNSEIEVKLSDAKDMKTECDLWITDPPYADAINYHELSEFFLAWDKNILTKIFPDWYVDSKRPLALYGRDNFARNMIEIYGNLKRLMNDDGMQIVMFTHKDTSIWAQLALIMWKCELQITAAWNVATETDASGLKDGSYVKGTVLMVLRKRTGEEVGWSDEIMGDVRAEVRRQIDYMQNLDQGDEKNFSDPDYVLAAYAASMKILTGYKAILDIDFEKDFELAINEPAKSEVVKLIERAKKIAYDYVIPKGFEKFIWEKLSPAERFYIKGLESEKGGNYQVSTYQEYAKGFGLSDYKSLMYSEHANKARLKTPDEFAMKSVKDVTGFDDSLLRLVLEAVYISVKEDNADKGVYHIKSRLNDYWDKRKLLLEILKNLKDIDVIDNMKEHWHNDAEMAGHIFVKIDNDHA